MKQDKPAKAPPHPRPVLLERAHTLIDQAAKGGQLTPQMEYLQAQLPPLVLDRWGQVLPLSSARQERLDRMMAVFVAPEARVRALLRSGSLDTIEVNALRYGHPDVYEQLRSALILEMAKAGPPLPSWSESVLGIFFGRDAALVYTDGREAEKPGPKGAYPGKPPLPTPADLTSEEQLRRSQ